MTAGIKDVAGKSFDYVIIGGGTTGLVLAARLTEDPSTTVAVLEAGLERLGDPLIDLPAQYGKVFGDERYAWNFATIPQVHSNNRSVYWPRGKVLGGSSAINFYVWNKPPSADIDEWEALGNPGWNWARFNEYSKKAERFTPSDESTATKYKQKYNQSAHGFSGPLKIAFPQFVSEAELPFQQGIAIMKAGVELAKDPQNGDPIGTWTAPSTVAKETQTRSYSASAYYKPNATRPNLHVLCGALVHRLIIYHAEDQTTSKGPIKADSVEFEHDGTIYSVSVGKEVIMCAGALKSPQILELSGIGRKDTLEPLGIKTILDLPGVGSNMQEHILTGIVFELDPKHKFETLDCFADPAYAEKQLALHAEGKGTLRMGISGLTFVSLHKVSSPETARAIIDRQRLRIEARRRAGGLSPGLEKQYDLLLESYEKGVGGECEIVCFPGWFGAGNPEAGKNYVSLMTSFNRPFSRGTIHAKSKDPHDQPEMDPRYFEQQIDLEVITETLKFMRRVAELEPFKDIVVREVAPGPSITEDKALQEYIKNNAGTTFHTSSTLSMLPRSLDGVVNPSLQVYGTNNIRVADLSIVPLHFAAHTQSVAYAIGEQAADIIKGSSC